MRNLTEKEITILTNQGCIAEDWSTIQVKDGFTPQYISNVDPLVSKSKHPFG